MTRLSMEEYSEIINRFFTQVQFMILKAIREGEIDIDAKSLDLSKIFWFTSDNEYTYLDTEIANKIPPKIRAEILKVWKNLL